MAAAGGDVPRLYKMLEITPAASPEDIKRAYRKMALKYHPDKAGQAGVEQFNLVKEAYDILSDPSKRRVYDQYGEQGLSYLNNPYAEPFVSNFGSSVMMVAGSLSVLAFSFLMLLFFSFVAARVDSKISWSWGTIFSPIWVLDTGITITAIVAGVILVKNYVEDKQDGQKSTLAQKIMPFFVLCLILLYVAFTITIAIGVSSTESVNWIRLFIPGLVAEVGIILSYVPSMNPARLRQMLLQQGFTKVSMASCVGFIVCNFITFAFRLPLIALIGAKLDGSIGASWWTIGLPLYVYLCSNVTSNALMGKLQLDNNPEVQPAGVALSVIISMGLNAMHLVSACLTIAKIEGTDIALGKAVIPSFILLGGLFVVSAFMSCIFCQKAAEQYEEEQAMEDARRAAEQFDSPHANYTPQYMHPGGNGTNGNGNSSSSPRRDREHEETALNGDDHHSDASGNGGLD